MSKFPLFIELVIKQTCRRASYESDVFNKTISLHPNNLNNVQPEKNNVYSLEFIKKLHERARDHIYTLLSVPEPNRIDKDGKPISTFQYLISSQFGEKERKYLLDFLINVKALSPPKATLWIDLQHFIQYVYRNFVSPTPNPEEDVQPLSNFFINEMRELVKYLMQEDVSQLFLRIVALIREYCIFAQWNYSKGGDKAITKLVYYYEAMLSAAKNCAPAFRDFEVLIYKHYSLGWIDFNTCLFIRFFFETDYVQLKTFQCLEFKESPGDSPEMFALLENLRTLWEKEKKRLVKINDDSSVADTTDFFYIEEAIINSHKKVLKCNFWVQRPNESCFRMRELDLRRFDHHLFRLLNDPLFHPAGPILDKYGQCICEECCIAKYKKYMDHTSEEVTYMIRNNVKRVTFCRRCDSLIELEKYHTHINSHSLAEEYDSNERMSSGSSDNSIFGDENNIKALPNLKNAINNHFKRRHKKKHDPDMENTMEAFEKFLQKNDDAQTREEYLTKNVRNFIKIKKDIFNHNHDNEKMFDMFNANPALKKLDHEIKLKEIRKNGHKCDKLIRPQIKNGCEHHCKNEEHNKQSPCAGHMAPLCKPLKPVLDSSKTCDCSFCESAASHAHKSNELRDRLRVRLHQRREKRTKEACKTTQQNANNNTANSLKLKTAISKVEERVPLPSSPTNIPPAPVVKSSDSSLTLTGLTRISTRTRTPSTNGKKNDDINGLLNYIEGNSGLNKIELAQKKAAKKARQRLKKEQERLKAEEEQKRLEEEQKRKEDERKQELVRKKAEKEAAAQALAKKTKKERQAERKQQEKAAKKAATQPKAKVVEETIPAMVTIKRIAENKDSAPTVTITLKGSTPDQEKLLYNLVKGDEDSSEKENQDKNKKKKKLKQKNLPTVVTKELQVTVTLDQNKPKPAEDPNIKKLTKNNHITYVPMKVPPHKQKEQTKKEMDLPIPMFRLPPGITITKVEGPIANRSYPVNTVDEKKATSTTAKSGVIVVDTEKLIQNKQSTDIPIKGNKSKRNRKKKKNKDANGIAEMTSQNSETKMITLKNPIFQSFCSKNESPVDKNNDSCAPAAIFTNENGMVTIRSSRLQQSMMNGIPGKSIPKLLPEMQLPKVKIPTTSSLDDKNDISPFNAQEILSGLPGIEITKVDKTSTKLDSEMTNKSHPTAQISIIPTTNGGEKFDFEKDDWLYDNVFKPRDVLEDDMDPDELELEAFKRFCQQSIPPPVKDKVAHLNVAELMLKKKPDLNFV